MGPARDQLRGQLRDQLGASSQGPAQGPASSGPALGPARGPALGPALLREASSGPAQDQLGDQLRYRWIRGSRRTGWGSTAGRAIAGEPEPRLDALTRACSLLGWWWPQHGPSSSPTGRPSSPGTARAACTTRRPGLAWADRYALYAWHTRPRPASWSPATAEPPPSCGNPTRRSGGARSSAWGGTGSSTQQASPGSAAPYRTQEPRPRARPVRRPRTDLRRRRRCPGPAVHQRLPGRDGSRRRFGLTVPADITDPLHAAAWG